MKMVLLDGGLANQMTQYIFARCLQEEQPDELVLLDDLWFYCSHGEMGRRMAPIEHHEYQLSKFHNIKPVPLASSYFDADVWSEIVEIAQRLPPLEGGSYLPQILKDSGLDFFMIAEAPLYRFDGKIARMPYYHYMPEMLQSQGNTYYFGWFTHGGWFMRHEELFRQEFELPPLWQPHDLELQQKIAKTTAVCVHIRRGTYAARGTTTPGDYFKQAVRSVCGELKKRRKTLPRPPHFFIFSDEIEWCQEHAKEYGIANIPYPVTYGRAERTHLDNHCDMQLMAQCDIMILELNSVYSYMAALLNPKKNKIVINPNKGRGIFFNGKGSFIMKKALITGITGQDGSFLAEFLLEKGYEVHGVVRRASIANTARIDHLLAQNAITLHDGDLSDASSLIRIIGLVQPDEVYNLAAQSHVQVSFDVPEYSGDVDAIGVLRILEAIRILGLTKKTRFYQASTSELFGKVEEVPQKETTPFHPYSPYAVAKQYGYWITREYREAYGMFAANGILFNHESERRGENFVTRKITLAAGRIAEGLQDHLELGNMDSLRDWGYARDYVECMWLMLQQDEPDDFVIATGEQHTVREFVEAAFTVNGMSIRWEGTGMDEKGYDEQTGKLLVCVNPKWYRPTDVVNLLGDPTKARTVLRWNPQATSFTKLVEIMAGHDRELARRERRQREAADDAE